MARPAAAAGLGSTLAVVVLILDWKPRVAFPPARPIGKLVSPSDVLLKPIERPAFPLGLFYSYTASERRIQEDQRNNLALP